MNLISQRKKHWATHLALVCSMACGFAVVNSVEAAPKKRKARSVRISRQVREKVKKRLSQSAGNVRERAESLDASTLYHAAFYERVQMARSGSASSADLEKLGTTALALGRFEPLAQLGGRGSGAPASFRVAMAAFHLRSGAVAKAAEWLPDTGALSTIDDSSARVRAAVIMSAVRMAQGQSGQAFEALNAIPEARNPVQGGILALQRARIHYNEGRNTEALEELQRVTRQSAAWYPGVMVAAWSAYRVRDYNLTLGQLMTLHSPHLAGKFNPESYTLQAATLYRLCYFESAATSLSQLKSRYGNIVSSIDRFRRQYENKFSLVSTVLNYARGEASDEGGLPDGYYDYIMDGLLSNDSMSEVDRSLLQVKQEEKILDEVAGSSLSPQMRSAYKRELESARREYYRHGLKAAMGRLNAMRREASEALEGALAIEVEINTRIRERLITGKTARMRDIDFDAEIKKGYEFWPFQGEYWQDEVGGYAFATSDICGDQGS